MIKSTQRLKVQRQCFLLVSLANNTGPTQSMALGAGSAAMNAASDKALLTDPKDYMTRVRRPVLAFFGENDESVPAKKSAELYEQYLQQAGNQDVTIVMFPGVGHSLGGFMPAYWEQLSDWLKRRAG